MAELRDIMEDEIIQAQHGVHAFRGTLEAEATLLDGVPVFLGNDKGESEYTNLPFFLWDSANSLVDMSNVIADASVDIVFSAERAANSANTKLLVELVIPDTPEIVISPRLFILPNPGEWYEDSVSFMCFNSAAAKANNFKIRVTSVGGDTTLKNGHGLIRI